MIRVSKLLIDVNDFSQREDKLRNINGYLLFDQDSFLVTVKKSEITTTNATPATLYTISLVDGDTKIIDYRITGRKINPGGAGDGNSVSAWGTLSYKNVGGTVTQISAYPNYNDEIGATALNFNISGNDIMIDVTGVAATTIDWKGRFDI